MKKLFLLCGILFLTLGVGCRSDAELIKNNIKTPHSDFQTENICLEEGQLADPKLPCCAGLYKEQIDDGTIICSKKENSTDLSTATNQTISFSDFNKNDYNKAQSLPARVVFLYFNSTNCSTCFKELADLKAAFEELKKDPDHKLNIIGFIVDMDDKYTDLDEKALAKEFKASKHTKIFFAKESGISQFDEQWDTQKFLDYIIKIKASWGN